MDGFRRYFRAMLSGKHGGKMVDQFLAEMANSPYRERERELGARIREHREMMRA